MTTTDFSTWSRENLERFAQQSFTEITELKKELKEAIEAYRQLNRSLK